MDEKNRLLKARKRVVVLLLICLIIAFSCIGLPFFMMSSNKEEEALNLSELILNDNVNEGQYVKLDIDTLPILMSLTPTSKNDSQFYYVTDVNNHIYIVNLSNETFKSIVETLNNETGKLNSTYQLKGTTVNIDEQIKKLALSNSYKVFKNNEINLDNFSEYLGGFYVKENFVSERVAALYKISVLLGVFFLVLALGYLVPAIIKINKGEFGIFDEKNIMQALEKHLPDRETLTAGVQGVGLEVSILQIFKNCIFDGEKIIPSENGKMLQVNKRKVSSFDVYVGITENYLILSQCKVNKWFYAVDELQDSGEIAAKEVSSCIPLENIGICFPLADVQSCAIKKGWMDSVKCTITMNNGSYLKLQLPKLDELPHHAKYREAILARLSGTNS